MSAPSGSRPSNGRGAPSAASAKGAARSLPNDKQTQSSRATDANDDDDGAADLGGQGAVAGPSSPSRRRRRPNATRRRSSSISAAASLLSSYSASRPERRGSSDSEGEDHAEADEHPHTKRKTRPQNRHRATSTVSGTFAPDAATIARDAKRSFFQRKASPYHMALVTVMFSLASDMPLASQFKVYSFMMCKILQMREGVPDGDFAGSMMGKALASVGLLADRSMNASMLPPAPELPSNPVCEDTWVQDATSTYAAAMATVGALIGLLLLNRCSKISQRFGRKPLLLVTHVLLALSTLAFRLSVFFPTLVGVTTIYVAVVVLEASAGAPLRIAIQNYVVDTTTESQRAGALSFTDGFGQVGAFPSGALGGWLSAVTQNFFAPFYASLASYLAALSYILVFVPESKKRHEHTIIDDFEEWHQHHGTQQEPEQNGKPVSDSRPESGAGVEPSEEETYAETISESYIDNWSRGSPTLWARFRALAHRFNFLSPLAVFVPRRRIDRFSPNTKQGLDWRVFNLAIIVVLEESFQVFLLPMLLLYNTKVFGYDVVQNGYLVSLLQGVRALYLTVIFPMALSKIRAVFKRLRDWQAARNARLEAMLAPRAQQEEEPTERTHLLRQSTDIRLEAQAQENKHNKREERGRLDIIVMFFSYVLSAFSFGLLSTTRTWSETYDQAGIPSAAMMSSPMKSIPPYVVVALAIVGVQLGAGATSLRTALLVNAVSEQEDEREEAEALREAQWHAHVGQNGQQNNDRQPSVHIHVHHERHQTKALAANQILCTMVYAIIPLVTSRIFGAGLVHGRPELVWIFKSAVAFVCAAATLTLLMSYGLAARRQVRSASA